MVGEEFRSLANLRLPVLPQTQYVLDGEGRDGAPARGRGGVQHRGSQEKPPKPDSFLETADNLLMSGGEELAEL